ncbi:MAG: hypothetical protein CMJ48_10125 [Planctomycetaceae bacterium]|nr:hypothetical protein [Planctomycetaceae bacterium]
MTLSLTRRLIDELNEQDVEYCHWKSNCRVDGVFSGETDIDLLVGQGSVAQFHRIIFNLEFKAAELPDSDESHSVVHFYGFDEASGILVHLHVYYRVITGGSILKNYHLPIEGMLLENTTAVNGLKVPDRAAELGLFVIRKMIEHGTAVELLMVRREIDEVRDEIDWLLGDDPMATIERACVVIRKWLPTIDPDLLRSGIGVLRDSNSLARLFGVARRFRRALESYQLHGWVASECLLVYRFGMKVFHRFFVRNRTHTFRSGGIVIAITGPEATGKSTVVNELQDWLGEHFTLKMLHAGKPPSSWLTWLPNRLTPLLRRTMRNFRTTNIEADLQDAENDVGSQSQRPRGLRLVVYAVRSLMIAFDRKTVLGQAYRRASCGTIVICDRYPSRRVGAMDSAQLDPQAEDVQASKFCSRVARIENHIYETIPQPNVAIQLTVSADIAVERDRARSKSKKGCEGEDYVRRRHKQAEKQEYALSHAVRIDTSQPIESSLLAIKKAIWSQV